MKSNNFIDKAKDTHGNRYNYSLVEYINSRTKIKIICPDHGVFEQTPYSHKNGCGCPECSGLKKYLITHETQPRLLRFGTATNKR